MSKGTGQSDLLAPPQASLLNFLGRELNKNNKIFQFNSNEQTPKDTDEDKDSQETDEDEDAVYRKNGITIKDFLNAANPFVRKPKNEEEKKQETVKLGLLDVFKKNYQEEAT